MIHTEVLTGYGSLEANGGNGNLYGSGNDARMSGGGAGGRIAIYLQVTYTLL